MEQRLSTFQPDPLAFKSKLLEFFDPPPIITSSYGKRIVVNDVDCLNLGTHNYLCLSKDSSCTSNTIDAVYKYGVGSCGPRGFFGTVGKNFCNYFIIYKFTI